MKNLLRLAAIWIAVLSGGCNFTPQFRPPDMDVPPHFKEGRGWTVAKPAAHLPHGRWWSMFHDPELDAILRDIEVSNQSLQSAVAKAEAVAALLKAATMALLPTLDVSGTATRSKSGAQGGSTNPDALSSNRGSGMQNSRSITFASMWEIDLWGRLRHAARAATADAQAAQGDVQSTLLSLQTVAAQNYFSLRAADAQKSLLEGEVKNYQGAVDLTKNRYELGVDSGIEVAQAETQLANAKVSLIEVGVQRATLEHGLATVTGRAPAAFGLKDKDLTSTVPPPPAAAPSTLLERRPDVSAAERRVAAANERVGEARAAFFPTLTLSGDTGWRGLTDLISKSNNFWSIGAEVAEPILDSGKRIAAKEQADANLKGAVADYRQTVLSGLQEAEDALSTLRILAAETMAQEEAVRAARESERISINQYKAGKLSYINVAVAQAQSLAAESNLINIRSRRLSATVSLIKALGGSW
jgi:NodT family efflux transporter outer membrane factor (OMF) lipoprotein